MSEPRIRIGIGGWTYPPWRGEFYPDKLPQRQELEYASAKLGAIAGLVTAPIAKATAREAGFAFAGHTDFLAARLGACPEPVEAAPNQRLFGINDL